MSIEDIFRIDQWDFERESILKDLPAADVAKLMERKTEHRYKRGEVIVVRKKYKGDFAPGEVVEINMSRDDLASLVGTARENVVRMLSEFKEEGILETRGRKIIVRDIKKLVAMANYT